MIPFPDKMYQVIYADPPWSYDNDAPSRSVTNHYPVMSLQDICELPVKTLSDRDCVLFLWTTITHLEEAFCVIASWGFKYKSCFVWDKKIIGTGYYTRSQHEYLMICIKGNPKCPNPKTRFPSLYSELRKEHSKKPKYFRSIIELMYPNKYRIELFSRDKIEGWDCWGNEVPTSEQKLIQNGNSFWENGWV